MGCGDAVSSNVEDLKKGIFWKALLAEFIGTLLLTFAGCSSCVPNTFNPYNQTLKDDYSLVIGADNSSLVAISLTFGIAVATIVWSIAHVSGGHINPAVTAGMLIARKITLVRALLYIVSQSVGAIVGAALLNAINPTFAEPSLGYTKVAKGLTVGQGFGVELVITFVLVFTVFASCDKRRKDIGGSVPLTIGLSITLCHLFAIKYTGSSMNPARSFGPAVVGGMWDNHWLYWCGPICGGVIAGLLYELLFAVDASMGKLRGMFSPDGPDSSESESLDGKDVTIKMTSVTTERTDGKDYRM